jgi:diguanylate cyclase (GGDEF)-like protein/PAS domain S-box-containing protein
MTKISQRATDDLISPHSSEDGESDASRMVRGNEDRFRMMVEGSDQLFFFSHDIAHRFDYLSPSIETVLGYDPSELLGLPYDVLLADDPSNRRVHAMTDYAIARGDGFSTYTVLTRHKLGRIVPVEVVESPIARDGVVTGIQGFARDITDRRRAEEAIQASEASYRSLFNSVSELVYIQDRQGRFLSVNDAVIRTYGYAREELLGKTPAVLAAPGLNDMEAVDAAFHRALAGERQRFEFWARRKNGSCFPKEVALAAGTYFGQDVAIAVARDVTDRHAVQDALRTSERYFRSLTENAHDIIHVINPDHTTRYLSPSVTRLLGHDPDVLVGRPATQLIDPEDFAMLLSAIRATRKPGEPFTCEFRARHQDGSRRIFEGAARDLSTDPVVSGVVINARDITERKRSEVEILRLAALSLENPNPVVECAADGQVLRANPAAEEVAGELGLESVMGLLPTSHLQLVHKSLAGEQGLHNVEATINERIFAWTYRSNVATGVVYLFAAEITGRRHMEEQLRHDALHDALTGLPNRMFFMERLSHAIQRSKRREDFQFAVLFLDLDRFKVINDSLGHHVGDELLRTVAGRLQCCLRNEDTVARFGGDEFAILLEETTGVDDASRVAERIQTELAAPVSLGGFEVFTSASIGIALSSSAYERPEYLLRNADMAMYRAKSSGQSTFEIFDREMHARALARLQMETDLRRALERNEYVLMYQPIVAIGSGKITGVEALIRWNHPDRGTLGPDEFIAVAEETGLILPIGSWVLEEACRQLREWRDLFGERAPSSLGVNLSPKQFSQFDLVEEVRQVLESNDLEPQLLRLEITENAVMESADSAVELLGRLKTLGVQISLDDFGTGYSSLRYLHRFPLDALKVDRSFVGRMEHDERSAHLVRTVLTLARSLGVLAIAEGIEEEGQLRMLREMGCDMGQGFLFARPLTAAEMADRLESGDQGRMSV